MKRLFQICLFAMFLQLVILLRTKKKNNSGSGMQNILTQLNKLKTVLKLRKTYF